MDELITTVAAAKILSVTPATIRNIIREGRLQAINLNTGTGKRAVWRVRMSSLLALLELKRPKALEGF